METNQRASDYEKHVNSVVINEKYGLGAMGSLVVSLHKIKYSYDGQTNYCYVVDRIMTQN